jgi:hypothetical protein
VTKEMNMIRWTKMITGCGERELFWISLLMHVISITAQPNIQQLIKSMCCHFQTVQTKETQTAWDKN